MVNRELFERMVAESGWEPGDGYMPGHWHRKPPGHRCLWSVRWMMGNGRLITPDDIRPYWLDPPPPIRVVDGRVIVSVGNGPRWTALDIQRQDEDERVDSPRKPGIRIQGLRDAELVYLWPWAKKPETAPFLVNRPGWDRPEGMSR